MDKEKTPDDPLEPPTKRTKLGSESQQEGGQSSTASDGDGYAGTSETKPQAIERTSDGPAATGATTSSSGPGKLLKLYSKHSYLALYREHSPLQSKIAYTNT